MTFRLRLTRLLIVPVAVTALATDQLHPDDSLLKTAITALGVLLLVGAAAGRAWASVHMSGRKNEVLVRTGPYAFTRNPLYLFSLAGFMGVGFALGSLVLAAIFAAVFLVSHWPTILAEERTLAERFGPAWDEYRATVPRFLPRLRAPARETTLTVNTRKLSLALRDCMAIPLVLLVVEFVEWAQLAGILPVLLILP